MSSHQNNGTSAVGKDGLSATGSQKAGDDLTNPVTSRDSVSQIWRPRWWLERERGKSRGRGRGRGLGKGARGH